MDVITAWWNRNWGGILAACILAVFFYAMTSWVRNTVTDQLKNYVPTDVWQQWAQERGEWRGKVDTEIIALQRDNNEQKVHIISQLTELKSEIRVLNVLLLEHKKETEMKKGSP